MFKKPIILCVTRREQDSQSLDGFDMDFVVVLDPSDPKIAQELTKITALVQKHLREQDKFYLTVDLSWKTRGVDASELQETSYVA